MEKKTKHDLKVIPLDEDSDADFDDYTVSPLKLEISSTTRTPGRQPTVKLNITLLK